MTIKDIARISGYSVGTVSRVLNQRPDASPQAREKIMAVVEEHRFRLNSNAKHLKQQAANGVAVVVKGTQNMLFATIVERVQARVRQRDSAVFLHYLEEDGDEIEQALQISRERRPQGILFLGSNFDHFQARFAELALPCVMVTNSGVGLDFPNLSSVSTDDEWAAREAMERLIALGHREIGVLGGCMGISDAATGRFRGCQQAFDAHGMVFDRERQYEMTLFSMSNGYEAMGRLLDKMPELTAVFAMSDVQAVGAIRALHDRGLRVPEDISVMGFDGIELGNYITPKLSTVQQDARRLADRGVEILFAQMEDNAPTVHERTPFRLLEGESVAVKR